MGNFNLEIAADRSLTFLAEPEKLITMPKFDISVYPNLMKAAELLDESNYTQAQLDAYDRHLMAVYDINRSRIESFDKGFDEGIDKGIGKGLQLSIAIYKDIQKGDLTHEAIALQYGISVEEVEKLAAAFT
jgi:predicted transposase/invertase (TIGR01784 family)